MLIQKDKVLLIFFCLQANLQLFQDYRALLPAQAIENFFGNIVQLEKSLLSLFCNFTILLKEENAFMQVDRAIRIKQCYKHGH